VKTISQICKQTGVSVRTLHHYDAIGLLPATTVTEAGYRLYDEAALERLYMILLFRELGFSLKDIGRILDAPDYDRNRVLQEQSELLQQKAKHLQTLSHMARGIQLIGVRYLDFENFDVKKIDEYETQAKTLYGKTEAYREYTEKAKGRTREQEQRLGEGILEHFAQLGQLKTLPPEDPRVQAWVGELQQYFTGHFYTCTPQILLGLADMYAGGGTMTENIAAAGGAGAAAFAREAILVYCGK